MIRRALLTALLLSLPAAAFAQGETIEYYGLDALGSVRIVFDANGNVLMRADHAPFGAEVVRRRGCRCNASRAFPRRRGGARLRAGAVVSGAHGAI